MKFVAHGKFVQSLAKRAGWHPAARYTNLRDISESRFQSKGFLDIDWKRYDFDRHLLAARRSKPLITVARDLISWRDIDLVLREAENLAQFASHVVIVPKHPRLGRLLDTAIPPQYILGYSVPTRYGGTRIAVKWFRRPVHLLGGRPDTQRTLADQMPVVSMDCNRFTLDAAFGDYFDGETFRPHPVGGYRTCLADSMKNIGKLWDGYRSEGKSAVAA